MFVVLLRPVQFVNALPGADQFSSDGRGADFPSGVYWCATKELTGLCSSSNTVVGYDLVISHTKLRFTATHLAF